jgi:competence protein ComEC
MHFKPVPIWKDAPFLRLISPLIAGIVVQYYLQLPVFISYSSIILSVLFLLLFRRIKTFTQFKWNWVNGILLSTLLFFTGAILIYHKDISKHERWINNYYKDGNTVVATLQEPLSEKEKSFKAIASADKIISGDRIFSVEGSLLIYFRKDSSLPKLDYGSQIVFSRSLTAIKNSGNPGAFDYQRYCAFQGIYHQVFLKEGEFAVLPGKNENVITRFLFSAQQKTVAIFQKFIPGNKERGFAEALLIGYKDDLDKNLVQSYTNTGVVHIIAISGMQLALIYGFLIIIFKPFSKFRFTRFFKPVAIIITLWLFSLMSGASASVLRAAVMLTCIVIGESFSKKTSVYNILSASAFLLLCYNPYWLWDVGFQLSYIAVLSIVIFMKPVYHLFYIKNKILDFIWQLTSVTLAAQILTTPISIFHFHQFPNYFLLTNLVAVPLSSIILFGEIFLCAVSFVPFVAKFAGIILNKLIWLLNSFIEHMETMPKSIWENLQVNIFQTLFLYISIACIATWLMKKKKNFLFPALAALFCFAALRSFSFWQSSQQNKLIVYNVPQHQAIDFIAGRNYMFKGDSIMHEDGFLQNFHLKPSRIKYRISETGSLSALQYGNSIFQFGTKKILVIDQPVFFSPPKEKINVDVIILSKNPSLNISNIDAVFEFKNIVFDASNANWKIKKWQTECEQLHLPCYNTVDNGAFEINTD